MHAPFRGRDGQVRWLGYRLWVVVQLVSIPVVLQSAPGPVLGQHLKCEPDAVDYGTIDNYDEKSTDLRGDFLEYLRQKQLKNPQTMTDRELINNILIFFVGAVNTNSASLRACFYYLVKTPYTYAKLVKELQDADAKGLLSETLSFTEGQKLPYLQACIKEALRMYPVVGTPFDRVVPKGGAILSGYFIPEGTVVGISGWVTQRNKQVFGDDAESYRPERWLDADEKQVRVMDRSMLAVSTSSALYAVVPSLMLRSLGRAQGGKHVAMMVLTKTVGQIVREFDMEWAARRDEWEETCRQHSLGYRSTTAFRSLAMVSTRSEVIKSKPIGDGLNVFRDSFNSLCKELGVSSSVDGLQQIGDEGLQNSALDLISALQILPASRILRSNTGNRNFYGDLLRLNSAVNSDDFDIDRVTPLLKAVINNESDDIIWDKAYAAVTEFTPPPRPLPFVNQTPWSNATSSIVNSSEHRKYVDDVLKDELGSSLYIGVPGFYDAFFRDVEELDSISQAVFAQCQEGGEPIFSDGGGWRDWPNEAKEPEVLKWFAEKIDRFLGFATDLRNVPRRLLAQPNQPLEGSTAERKLDVGFVDSVDAEDNSKCHWSQIMVIGELKSNPGSDTLSKTWRDLARYAREVFFAQDTRRFVLGFTLCGSVMRLWEFDRLGGIASSPFDINQDGLQFVSVVLGYLRMNKTQLGFDPTILEADGERYIEIMRHGRKERLVIDETMKRAGCVAGRATTCWKAHLADDDTRAPLVIKDSWQYPERDEEGELLREATDKEVVNVARHYCHETVHVAGERDDVRGNVRRNLDISKATNYFVQRKKAEGSMLPPKPSGMDSSRRGRSTADTINRKRSSSSLNAPLPPKKRTCSSSPTKREQTPSTHNRIRRRVIVRDYGTPIYKASSCVAMIAALEGCIEGYESLHDRGSMLQRDVSIGNLMMNEDVDNPSWPSFLIDLDLAIRSEREEPSGARSKTGTRAFMAIGVLLGEKHSFMHDLESFFWVLLWICIHYNGPTEKPTVVHRFDKWNFSDTEELAESKKGAVVHEGDFKRMIEENIRPYYKSLQPWLNRLRKVVFPNGGRWEKEDRGLYSRMKEVLRETQRDLDIAAD
ncbi:hypothetical protein V500_00447 [Pseudogymnoascus sp. VKM F-4518 (FW-2643)]|nr:hypothetical protein V500_00447 [Pseudogymnoascus sp. VKM F-4518 (FW-2643)]